MSKLKEAFVRDILHLYLKEEISFSRFVEILNAQAMKSDNFSIVDINDDQYYWHELNARATLYPNMTFEDVQEILDRKYIKNNSL